MLRAHLPAAIVHAASTYCGGRKKNKKTRQTIKALPHGDP
jgi:hypothetical protein